MKLFLTHIFVLFTMVSIWGQTDDYVERAQQMPYFKGCESLEDNSPEKRKCSDRKLVEFISANLQYPPKASEAGLEGTVIVTFMIDINGQVINTDLLRDIGGGCGEEALRVLNQMPYWEPGIDNDETVIVKLNLPIRFNLKAEEEDINRSDDYKITWGQLKPGTISRKKLKKNIDNKVLLRDQFGNTIPLAELQFTYRKRKRTRTAKSNGAITDKMAKVIKKSRRGGIFTIIATIQKDGQFFFVDQEFEVVK